MYKGCSESLGGGHPSSIHRTWFTPLYEGCGHGLTDVDPSTIQ